MKQLNDTDDQELFNLLRAGSEAGLDGLFRKYYMDLCRTADRLLKDESAAEDVVQEMYLNLWKKRTTLPVLSSVVGYLKRSVRNRSLNYLRDQKRIPQADGEMPVLATQSNAASVNLEAQELKDKIDRGIDALPERCRLVFVLSKFEDLSHKEIAKALDISPKTVENQMSRAYRFLREYLSLGVLTLILNLL